MSDTLTTTRQQIALLDPNTPAIRSRKYAPGEPDLCDEGLALWVLDNGLALGVPAERFQDAQAVLECRGMTPRARGLAFVLVDADLNRVGEVTRPWELVRNPL